MKSVQPNFECLKRAFFNSFEGCLEADIAILKQTMIAQRLLPHVSKRRAEFLKDFNTWLDQLDIRCVGELIDAIVKRGVITLPSWLKHKKFIIDYNKNEALDLIKIKQPD